MLGGGLAKSLLARLHGLWIMIFRALMTICCWVMIGKELWIKAEATLSNGLAPVFRASMIAIMILLNLLAMTLTEIKNWTAKTMMKRALVNIHLWSWSCIRIWSRMELTLANGLSSLITGVLVLMALRLLPYTCLTSLFGKKYLVAMRQRSQKITYAMSGCGKLSLALMMLSVTTEGVYSAPLDSGNNGRDNQYVSPAYTSHGHAKSSQVSIEPVSN